MEISNMKNIVVLKHLPSNLIDEAIVILKANKNAKRLEYVENSAKSKYIENGNEKDYVVKEAEYIISNYISELEKNKKGKNFKSGIDKKYRRLKTYSIVVSIVLFIALMKTLI